MTITVFLIWTKIEEVFFDLFGILVFSNLFFVGGHFFICYIENRCLKKIITELTDQNIINDPIDWTYKSTQINPFYKKPYAVIIYNNKLFFFLVDISVTDLSFYISCYAHGKFVFQPLDLCFNLGCKNRRNGLISAFLQENSLEPEV